MERRPRSDKEREEILARWLKRRINRRQALKTGGIAVLGLSFSKPLIETLYPKPAFAQYAGAEPPAEPEVFEASWSALVQAATAPGLLLRITLEDGTEQEVQLGPDEVFQFAATLQGVASIDTGGSYNVSGSGSGILGQTFPTSLGGEGVTVPISVQFAFYANDSFEVSNEWANATALSVPYKINGDVAFTGNQQFEVKPGDLSSTSFDPLTGNCNLDLAQLRWLAEFLSLVVSGGYIPLSDEVSGELNCPAII